MPFNGGGCRWLGAAGSHLRRRRSPLQYQANFKNKYDHVFSVEAASEAADVIAWVHRVLDEERGIVIASPRLASPRLRSGPLSDELQQLADRVACTRLTIIVLEEERYVMSVGDRPQ